MPQTQADPVAARLLKAPLVTSQRATVWQMYQDARDEDDLAEKLKALQIPNDVKADLWQMKYEGGTQAAPPVPEMPEDAPAPGPGKHPMARFGEMVTDALPMIGGAVGGTLGAIGGTVAGFGVGGVPGAAAGATMGGAAGEAGKQLLNRAMGRDTPDTPGEAAQGIATQGAMQGAMEGIAGGVPLVAGSAARAVYRGYLKPSLAGTELKKAREIVQTALREALPISQAGEARGKRLIAEINQQVNYALKNAGGKPVDLHEIAERVRSFARKRYAGSGAPKADFDAAVKVADEIDAHWTMGLPEGVRPTRVDVTPAKANETKQRLDRAIGDTGFGVERNAATEARKVGRHAARTAIEDVVPAVKGLNKRESELIDALESVTKAAGREENKDAFLGMRTLAAAGFGGASMNAGEDPTTALVQAAAIRAGLSPNLMSRAAILASKFAKVPGTGVALAARMGLIIAMRESDEEPPND